MATRKEISLLDSKEEVEVMPPLTTNLAHIDLRDCCEEEVYGDGNGREEVVFDIGDSNRKPHHPWPRFEYYEEEDDLNPRWRLLFKRDEELVEPHQNTPEDIEEED